MTPEQIEQAVHQLKNGGVVIFPTDTVWGIGAFVASPQGIEKLYSLKKRDVNKPTAILVGSVEQAMRYGVFSQEQKHIVSRYWPGGLTVVVQGSKGLPHQIINDRGGVGIRYPRSSFIERVTQELGGGLVTSSANISGGVTPTQLSEIAPSLIEESDLLVSYDEVLSGIPSTVVDLTGDTLKVIRQGAVYVEETSCLSE